MNECCYLATLNFTQNEKGLKTADIEIFDAIHAEFFIIKQLAAFCRHFMLFFFQRKAVMLFTMARVKKNRLSTAPLKPIKYMRLQYFLKYINK